MNFDLVQSTILMTVAGSRAYGIHTNTSDIDIKGVAVPPKPYFLGYLQRFEQADKAEQLAVYTSHMFEKEQEIIQKTKLEGAIYDLRKFMALAADANPNILDTLFCREEEVRIQTPLGKLLRESRKLFLSTKAKHTFSGYAAAQLKRIRGHRAWLLNPPKAPPTRAEYSLPEHTLIPQDQLAAAEAAIRAKMDGWMIDFGALDDAGVISIQAQLAGYLSELEVTLGKDAEWLAAARHVGLDDNLIHLMQREREYRARQNEWARFKTWERNRNPERAALEAKFGYDCKHGVHLVRLLRMGSEILKTGKVHVWRGSEDGGPGDVEELQAIRNGAWSYEKLMEWVDVEDKALQEFYQQKKHVIPAQPDRLALDRLCVQMVETYLGTQ